MKKILCILLAMLLVGCNQPTVPQETLPQETEKPVEEVVVPEEPIEEPAEEAVEPLKGEWSEELTALMEIINEEHKAVGKPALEEYKKYVQTPLKTPSVEVASPNEDGSFSLAQAEADVRYFYAAMQGGYGLYDYFGGDEVFFAKRDETIAALQACENLTKESFDEIVVEHLSFINDMHFNFNGKKVTPHYYVASFCLTVPFEKTEEGYKSPGGKIVKSVENHKNLDELFKRSLSVDGDIVYYPVVIVMYSNTEKEVAKPLEVLYTDGSTQTLEFEVYAGSPSPSEEMTWLNRKENVPVFGSMGCHVPEFSAVGETLKDEPVAIMDMRFNGGGRYEIVSDWYKNYTGGTEVPANMIAVLRNRNHSDSFYQGYQAFEDAVCIYTDEDGFIENDKLLIVLTSKNSASGAEAFTDFAHNLENTLIIGCNTAGCLVGSSGSPITLPNSRFKVNVGYYAHIWPETDHFSETYGLEPDLWCPPHYAEEAALNFIKKHVK